MDKLVINHVTFRYRQQSADVLQDVNLKLAAGSFNVLYGPSGSGKSTLLRLIAGLYPEYGGHLIQGDILIDGQNIETWTTQQMAQAVAILFQNPHDQFSMQTVEQEFIFTLENLGLPVATMDSLIDQALQRLGIAALRQRRLATLSGGELQKVSLAITLAMGSDLIVLDEPFASIDLKSRQALLKLLKELQETEHKTILITDHDLSGYQHLVDQLYHFEHGQVTQVADPATVFNTYAHYQQAFHFKLPAAPPLEQPLLEISNLVLKTPAKVLLNNTSLTIFKGKLCLLTGENGCGKSTFFAALTRLHDFSGTILYQQQDILKYKARDFAKQVALVFQDAQLQYLKLTVQEELDLSLKHAHFLELWDDATITDCLTRLHLDQLREQVIYQLSGGQKKKLQILEMLILGSPVLLMDEPLAGLDIDSLQVVIDLVRTMAQKQAQTIIMISHQLSGLQHYFDYHLTLANHQLTYTEVLEHESIR